MSTDSSVGMATAKTPRAPEPRFVRVLQIVAAPVAGVGPIGVNGPERRSANLIGQWRSRNVIPVVAYPRRGLLWDRFTSSGEIVEDFEIGSKWAMHRAWALLRIIRKHSVHVVHTQGPASLDLIAGIAAQLAGVPLIVTRPVMIEDMTTYSAWRRRVYQAIDAYSLRMARRIVAVSDQGAERLGRLLPRLRSRFRTIRNGVELKRFEAVSTQRTMRDSWVVGMTAQLTAQKSWPDFLAVIAALHQEGLPARGLIVGSGPLRAELEEMAGKLGLAEDVEFAGFHDDVAPLLARMDVFLFTSAWEGLSVAVIEAMAAGLPVVATDVAAIREQVQEGVNGHVCPPGDVKAMTAACARFLRDPALRLVQGQASARLAQRFFAESRMFADYAQLYHETE